MKVTFLFFLFLICGLAQAEPYPNKPITIIIGSTPGSTSDGLARAIGAEITKETGQAVIVDSKAGAFGGIAAQYVANAKPDGYTLFVTTNTTQAANPHLIKKLPYDPIKDFSPITKLVQGYMLLVTNPSLKVNSVNELIALAKKEPGKLTFGAGSSSARVAVELFEKMSGAEMVYVPYKSNPLAVMDLVGGQVDLMIVDLTTSLPQVKNDKLKALGVSSLTKSPLVPKLPTIASSLPGYEFSHWNALYGPAGMDAGTIKRINELFTSAMKKPSVKKFVEENGMEVSVSTPDGLSVFQNAELKRWGQIIKDAGIQPE
ncbi:ABC transporter substrate-binding protein [Polynucleobacter wuianus]|uniref:ABC transporter substrate-binding protein n=1 Tax=Polynucleobacter wuianus TaxID=1743168 RepID=A0A191UDZ4_9BURK|nr:MULTISPECIES: tripartite tricarboxylate transporter substrate binding protein [Polynucleobacter]ANI99283.1 ABC transporter substrate-binding protein [Polynucleobacter wuianus]MBU3552125.1 tripartite tricarboxylate transporter substrate binding protein [Polynucleobacter sp. MWH-Post4-6-1]